jgi:hypothetical protein
MQSAGRSDLLAGRATSRTQRRVLTEQRKAFQREAYRWSGGVSRSSWWLIARNGEGPFEVFTLDGGDTLPVFSGEGEAWLFLWLREECEHGWEVRESSAEELVFVLSGPCSRVGLVALDLSSEIFDDQAVEPLGLSREDFLEWIVSRSL